MFNSKRFLLLGIKTKTGSSTMRAEQRNFGTASGYSDWPLQKLDPEPSVEEAYPKAGSRSDQNTRVRIRKPE